MAESMSRGSGAQGTGAVGGTGLKQGAIGTLPLVFMVIAAAAPLGAVAGNTPLVIGLGNGIAAPFDFLLVGVLLLVFSVGYTAMSRHITNAGAFYAYISAGCGKRFGAAAGYVAVVSYSILTLYCSTASGYFTSMTLANTLGVSVPWWVCSIVLYALVFTLGYLGIDAGAKVLMVFLTCEIAVLAALDVAVLVHHGPAAFTLESFSAQRLFDGAPGLGFAFAFLCFIGFEATAIFGEEAKDPKRTVKRATYVAVILISVIYILSSWAGIAAMGADEIVAAAQGSGAGDIWYNLSTGELGPVFGVVYDWLFITSFFAAWFSSHNMATRYIYAFGRNHLLPAALAKTSPRFKSPYAAGILLTAVGLVVVVCYAIFGLDPYLEGAAVFSAIAVSGIIFVELIAAISFIPYFARHRGEEGFETNPWVTVIAPAIASLGLLCVLALVLANFSLLTGFDNVVMNNLPVLLLLVGVVGFVHASRMDRDGRLVDPMDIDVNATEA